MDLRDFRNRTAGYAGNNGERTYSAVDSFRAKTASADNSEEVEAMVEDMMFDKIATAAYLEVASKESE